MITLEAKQQVIEFYKSRPMTYETVSKQFNLSVPSVSKILRGHNIEPWSKFKIFSPNFVENYFENIDTPAKAYFLGLMITDGNIYDKYHSKSHPPNINLTLQQKDAYILELFKRELKLNKKIAHDGRGCCQIVIFSKAMKTDLQKYGVVPNKTFIQKFPRNLRKDLYPHLIRGIIDGDGSMSFYPRPNRKVHTKAVRLCSANAQFLTDILSFLYSEIGTQQLNIYKEKGNLYSFAFRNKNDLEKIIKYIYPNEDIICLKRKQEISQLILQEIRKYRDN